MKIILNKLQAIVNSRLCITTTDGEQYFGKLISYRSKDEDKSEITHINIATGLHNLLTLEMSSIDSIEEIEADEF